MEPDDDEHMAASKPATPDDDDEDHHPFGDPFTAAWHVKRPAGPPPARYPSLLMSPTPSTPGNYKLFNPDDFLVSPSPQHHPSSSLLAHPADPAPELKRRLFSPPDPPKPRSGATTAVAPASAITPTDHRTPDGHELLVSFTPPSRPTTGTLLNLTLPEDDDDISAAHNEHTPAPHLLIQHHLHQHPRHPPLPPPLPPPQVLSRVFKTPTTAPAASAALTPDAGALSKMLTSSELVRRHPTTTTTPNTGGSGNAETPATMPTTSPFTPAVPTPIRPTQQYKCSCKASKCLKLYCLCFAHSEYCSAACSCKNCNNTADTLDIVKDARESVLLRDPRAFDPKVRLAVIKSTATPDTGQRKEPARTQAAPAPPVVTTVTGDIHSKGCNCRKGCSKKYCVCRELKVECGPRCTCSGPKGCMNRRGMLHGRSDQKNNPLHPNGQPHMGSAADIAAADQQQAQSMQGGRIIEVSSSMSCALPPSGYTEIIADQLKGQRGKSQKAKLLKARVRKRDRNGNIIPDSPHLVNNNGNTTASAENIQRENGMLPGNGHPDCSADPCCTTISKKQKLLGTRGPVRPRVSAAAAMSGASRSLLGGTTVALKANANAATIISGEQMFGESDSAVTAKQPAAGVELEDGSSNHVIVNSATNNAESEHGAAKNVNSGANNNNNNNAIDDVTTGMFDFVNALDMDMGIDKAMDVDLALGTIDDGIDLDNVGQVNNNNNSNNNNGGTVPAELSAQMKNDTGAGGNVAAVEQEPTEASQKADKGNSADNELVNEEPCAVDGGISLGGDTSHKEDRGAGQEQQLNGGDSNLVEIEQAGSAGGLDLAADGRSNDMTGEKTVNVSMNQKPSKVEVAGSSSNNNDSNNNSSHVQNNKQTRLKVAPLSFGISRNVSRDEKLTKQQQQQGQNSNNTNNNSNPSNGANNNGFSAFGRDSENVEVCRLPRILRVKMGSGRLLSKFGI